MHLIYLDNICFSGSSALTITTQSKIHFKKMSINTKLLIKINKKKNQPMTVDGVFYSQVQGEKYSMWTLVVYLAIFCCFYPSGEISLHFLSQSHNRK